MKYKCSECGKIYSKKFGICQSCKSVGTLELIEENSTKNSFHNKKTDIILSKNDYPKKLSEYNDKDLIRLDTGLDEFNNVLGGGIVADSVNMLSGDPGIGKSTLLIQVASNIAKKYKVLYATGEESGIQVKDRAKRLGIDINNENLVLWAQENIDKIIKYIENEHPRFVIVDSMQTMFTETINSRKGSPTQLTDCCNKLISVAKNSENPVAIFIIGHNTKSDDVAGPKTISFLVDGTFAFEGDPFRDYRILRSSKNRFGSVNEIGIFEMKKEGLIGVKNPSKCFLEDSEVQECGSVISCLMEGTRPILTEVQSLVCESVFGQPRRMATGIDYNRMILISAILERKCGIPLGRSDIYVNIAGGLKALDRSVDLAIATAIINATPQDMKPIAKDICFLGELGLTGEVRYVYRLDSRIRELEKTGFKTVIVPAVNKINKKDYKKINVIQVKTIKEIADMMLKNKLS